MIRKYLNALLGSIISTYFVWAWVHMDLAWVVEIPDWQPPLRAQLLLWLLLWAAIIHCSAELIKRIERE